MMVEIISGDWNGEDGALQIAGDKPTIRFAGGSIAGSQSWITHVGSDGPGNFEFFTQSPSAPTSWAQVMALGTDGRVGIGESNPFVQGTGKLVVSVVTTPSLHAVVGINTAPTPAASACNGGWFSSLNGEGVRGTTGSAHGGVVGVNTGSGAGVYGTSTAGGDGVVGNSVGGGRGVVGVSANHTGVEGDSTSGVGVWGQSQNAEGVHGISHSPTAAGVAGYNDKGGPAGLFQGNVQINGNLTVAQDIVLTGADCAEDFDLSYGVSAEPGSVMVIDRTGSLAPCAQAYDRRVAGVVSGAGSFRPAFTLDRRESSSVHRGAIALVGKVYCQAVAPVAVGDMLTTSDIPGHAMRAADFTKAAGAVIGKAIGALQSGTGLVPMLVSLQ